MEFYQVDPSLENYWRGIILFGKNTAAYKFALAQALYELHASANDLITLEQLAEPFSRHLCLHLQNAEKQTTSATSKYLESCVAFNSQQLSQTQLIDSTIKLGFTNVIDAFHNVAGAEIEQRFFIDERKTHKGIRLTDNFFKLAQSQQFSSFANETDARWKLVEHAWNTGVSAKLLGVNYDFELQTLFALNQQRRINITSCRDSLNGYQKGHCFYCQTSISVNPQDTLLADVDHFFPWCLSEKIEHVNGVWNLVLACKECNRGAGGKFDKVPTLNLLRQLHKRNEYFINSHLPLRETLIIQTGNSEIKRRSFLQKQFDQVSFVPKWQPILKDSIIL